MLKPSCTGIDKTLVLITAAALIGAPLAHADGDNNTLVLNNKRLNDGVVANVYTVQHQAGCTNDVTINPQLQLAAQWHAHDLLNNRSLDGDIGSDGSTPESRADAAGFRGHVAETVAINPALAISGMEVINKWYYNPAYYAIMSNCANTQVGVWSENSPDRTALVAVYGQPQQSPKPPARSPNTTAVAAPPTGSPDIPIDPSPDYDASDELEFGTNWFAWILRGVYPPPGYPPN
ncbi:hypothetical protein AWB90_21045 [Mycobacterium paraense]|uniref:SCP domain-containing protein n=1 Tax=Mycobacterium paraense TaxID=767916 RepID=A0A1X2A719_9MYCO|nr:CAP domain-containing protein [Mycobacterium paraense]ORW41762.1 hypothetical protein AWB90_21045 [Mycobacterium paraense]